MIVVIVVLLLLLLLLLLVTRESVVNAVEGAQVFHGRDGIGRVEDDAVHVPKRPTVALVIATPLHRDTPHRRHGRQ